MYIVYSIILYLFPNVVFLEKDTLLPFYVWLFDLNIDYRIFTFFIVGWFRADLVNDVVSFVSILDLLLYLCSIDPWMSAERGFSKTLCLQMLENQMSVILVYAFWSFVTIYFQLWIQIPLQLLSLLSSGLRSHQIKRKVGHIVSCFKMFLVNVASKVCLFLL